MNRRLFVDMDGTLARFHDEAQYLERMWEGTLLRNGEAPEQICRELESILRDQTKAVCRPRGRKL